MYIENPGKNTKREINKEGMHLVGAFGTRRIVSGAVAGGLPWWGFEDLKANFRIPTKWLDPLIALSFSQFETSVFGGKNKVHK
jgi:hypothetical protein